MKIKSILTVVLIICSISVSAQEKASSYIKVSDYIFHNYHPDSVALSKFCRIGCVFVRFKVSPQGEISNISFSGDADSTQLITDALTIAVNSLKQDTALMNFLKKSDRAIIQPFIYSYQDGCNFPKMAKSGNATDNTANFYISYMMFTSEMDHVTKSLYNIFKFKDGHIAFFDGVLLGPFGIISAMH